MHALIVRAMIRSKDMISILKSKDFIEAILKVSSLYISSSIPTRASVQARCSTAVVLCDVLHSVAYLCWTWQLGAWNVGPAGAEVSISEAKFIHTSCTNCSLKILKYMDAYCRNVSFNFDCIQRRITKIPQDQLGFNGGPFSTPS